MRYSSDNTDIKRYLLNIDRKKEIAVSLVYTENLFIWVLGDVASEVSNSKVKRSLNLALIGAPILERNSDRSFTRALNF